MFDERIEEIIFHQDSGDRVRYIAKELDRPASCSVRKFFDILKESNVVIARWFDFKKAFDSFYTIKLNLKTNFWEIIEIDLASLANDGPKLDLKVSKNDNKKNVMKKFEKLSDSVRERKKAMLDSKGKK